MERYQVILAYDGAQYKGFQKQANAHSVQSVVEDALHKLNWQGKSILAAGRTDTGVHAEGQVIAFDLDWDHELYELQSALKANLPPDVVARDVRLVSRSFHPRLDACWRKYVYRIYCQPVRLPLLDRYAWRIWPTIDLPILKQAAHLLIGTHDFGAFGTPPQAGGSTIREVFEAEWNEAEPYYRFEIAAQAFLYHMVRRIVFYQVSIGQGNLSLADLRQVLENGADVSFPAKNMMDRHENLVHGLAPAKGLILTEVDYPPEVMIRMEDNDQE
jgi:tRNA pseudouridine38-40 synthase